jgi:hypothetical protein
MPPLPRRGFPPSREWRGTRTKAPSVPHGTSHRAQRGKRDRAPAGQAAPAEACAKRTAVSAKRSAPYCTLAASGAPCEPAMIGSIMAKSSACEQISHLA